MEHFLDYSLHVAQKDLRGLTALALKEVKLVHRCLSRPPCTQSREISLAWAPALSRHIKPGPLLLSSCRCTALSTSLSNSASLRHSEQPATFCRQLGRQDRPGPFPTSTQLCLSFLMTSPSVWLHQVGSLMRSSSASTSQRSINGCSPSMRLVA